MHLKKYKFCKTLGFIQLLLLAFLFQSCATYKVEKGKNIAEVKTSDTLKVAHQFFLVGDAGNADEKQAQVTLDLLKQRLDKASDKSTLLFLGDNIYPLGMPPEDSKDYSLAKTKMENQLAITKDFKGKTIVIPGNHDWYHGLKGLKAQEKFATTFLDDKRSFAPKKGCPIDNIKIGKDIALIMIDSEWYLENWDKNPGINADCDIKTKNDFFEEFEDLISKNQSKTIIVALHHPLMTGGPHGGYYSAKKQLYPFGGSIPLPILGTAINLIRATSGASNQDVNNAHYLAFTNRIKSIVQDNQNIIFVSGHEHNLQYLEDKSVRQIISGAGSKKEAAKVIDDKGFSYGGNGYAVLNVYKDGSAAVSYYSSSENKENLLTTIQVLKSDNKVVKTYPNYFPATQISSVYPEKLTQKSGMYKLFWGEHYRKYYGMPIDAKVATLDTLKGGLQPSRAGGGHQSNSLRLVGSNDQQFVMRGVKKSATRFLNAVAFKNETFGSELEGTFAEKFVLDFYTTSHPFTPFSVGNLAEAVKVGHSNPLLYYIPKQNALKSYNDTYGDELYMVEERFSDSPTDLEQLGGAKTTMNTLDMMRNLRKSDKYSVDEETYIRSRLFDMLIGDWDRHYDQWRWAEFKDNGKFVYKAIPKDRDQAFSKYDGIMFFFVMQLPALRHMQSFKDDIQDVKWFNREPYPLDLALIKNADADTWKKQAEFIQQNLTDDVIDHAFDNLPKEVRDATIKDIQEKIKIRRSKLAQYAQTYYEVLQKIVPIVGTEKADRFVISKAKKSVTVQQYRDKKSGEDLVFSRTYTPAETKEIWIYGLSDDDTFEVSGNKNPGIKIRLIGGQNHDTYDIKDGKGVIVYDFKSKENTYNIAKSVRKKITDNYDLNTYNYTTPKYNFWNETPNLWYNPDDGIKLGMVAEYVVNGYQQSPNTQKHTFSANYYFATSAIEAGYKGVFNKLVGKWDLNIDTRFATSNFTKNFYGFGNETINTKEEFGDNFYRVRMQQFNFTPALSTKSYAGLAHKIEATYEINKVEQNLDRYITQAPNVNPDIFNNQHFAGLGYTFSYDHSDNASFPTMGFGFGVSANWKVNLKETNRNFMRYSARINMTHKLDNLGKFVFATRVQSELINNDNFEFYQGTTVGGDNDLRSFRRERFLGKSSLFQTNDLRWNLGRVKNNIVPVNWGLFVGYDYGRVWMDGDHSNKWHQSVGGGLWFSILEAISARVTVFDGTDGVRVSAGLGMRF